MPTREAYRARRIAYLERQIMAMQEELGNHRRADMVEQGKPVNDQADYGGNMAPKEIHDPFLDSDLPRKCDVHGVIGCQAQCCEIWRGK